MPRKIDRLIEMYREHGMHQEADEVLAKYKRRRETNARSVNTYQGRNKELIRNNRIEKAKQNKLRAIAMLGGKCCRCGSLYPPCAMEFHHIDPTKKLFEVSGQMMVCSWEKLAPELRKCELVCVICHRIEHTSFDWARSMDVYDG